MDRCPNEADKRNHRSDSEGGVELFGHGGLGQAIAGWSHR
jgi:hypothetical protein